jgi:hypothetical protein
MVFDNKKKETGNNGRQLPDEVLERLQGYADANSIDIDAATQKFVEYLSDKFAVDNWQDEDDDFLIEASEGMVVQRRSGGGGLKTENWTGLFVGVDAKSRDKRKRIRSDAVKAYIDEPAKAINAGIVAEVVEQNGVWALKKADGIHATEEPSNKPAWFTVDTAGGPIALLQTGNWSSKGDPIYPELWSRYFYFLGNKEGDFGSAVKLWRFDSPVPDAQIDLFNPCRVKVVPNDPNREVNPDFADVFRLPKSWAKEISYTNDFVEADLQAQLAPEKFCVNPAIHPYFVSLTDALEHYHANLKEVPGINPVGPLVILKGKVTSLFKEGWDNEYDETGKTYNIRFTSWDLQREYPSGLKSEMQARIGGFLKENYHPFSFKEGNGWKPFAERSTVLVFGRLGVRQTEDDGEVPQVNAFGIHAVPRFVVPAADGGNPSTEQFN